MHKYRVIALQNGWELTYNVFAYNFQHARRKAINQIKRSNPYNGYVKVIRITQLT
jgi:hypothetical protein